MRARLHLRTLLPILLLTGCGGETFSDYNLKLVPHALQGQDPFQEGRVLKLMIQEPDSPPEFFFIGNADDTDLSLEELPPIAPGSTVGLLVEEAGGDSNEFNVDLAVAWGTNLVGGGLALGEERRSIDILVPELNVLGDMGKLSFGQRAFVPGVAMVNGKVFIFGGAKTLDVNEIASSKILRMANMDSGDFSFEKLDVGMPSYDTITGFYGAAALPIVVNGVEQILVTGGRMNPGSLPGDATNGAFLFDPETEEITWGTKPNNGRMNFQRSEHQMLLLDNGDVLIFGGFNPGFNENFEIFKTGKKRFEFENAVDYGAIEPAGVALGPQGAMICGGADVDNNTTIPVDGCTNINLQGLATTGPSLDTPVFAFGMTMLADGRVLAAGGVTVTTDDNGNAPASDRAWILDGNTWAPLPATLNFPRAHHRIIALPNGNALVLGGTDTGGGIFPNPTTAVACPELFDATTNVFVQLAPCTNSGAGAWPQWSLQPGDGLFVLAGYTSGDGGKGGDAYGFIAFTPEL